MNELLKINYNDDRITVSARDLYEFLEIGTRFNDWFSRMCEYGFNRGADYEEVLLKNEQNPQGGRPATDYQMTIEMGKEIAMIQRNEKGKQARQYFIELERRWNSPEYVMKRALEFANKQIEQLMNENIALKPKALFADSVSCSESTILIGDLAKLISKNGREIGQKRLFEWLRNHDYLMKKGKSKNLPTQRALDMGLFDIRETVISNADGSTMSRLTTRVTGKGQVYFVNKFCHDKNFKVESRSATN